MESFIVFAEVAGAIILSLGLAMTLEWLSLHWLLRLMPAQHGHKPESHS